MDRIACAREDATARIAVNVARETRDPARTPGKLMTASARGGRASAGNPAQDGESNMTSVNRDYVRFIRTDAVAAWIAFSDEDQRWHVEVFARTSKGIEYLETEYGGEQPSERQLVRDAFHYGFFSARPCCLEHRFDPSMTHGVLAML